MRWRTANTRHRRKLLRARRLRIIVRVNTKRFDAALRQIQQLKLFENVTADARRDANIAGAVLLAYIEPAKESV